MPEPTDNLSPTKALTELRAMIDGFAAHYAALRVGQGVSFRQLLTAFQRLQKAAQAGDPRAMAEADRALHLAIVQMAGVPTLEAIWIAVAQEQDVFRVETIGTCWPDLNVLFEAHRPIVDAICAASQVVAEDAAKAHLDAVWYRLAEMRDDLSLPVNPLARACTYLAFNLHESVRLGFLARHIAWTSIGHLERLFREEYGTTFTEYLRQLRMQKAVELLTRSTLPVARIAARVGYEDGSRFAQHFRRQFGLTPREYRRRFGPLPG